MQNLKIRDWNYGYYKNFKRINSVLDWILYALYFIAWLQLIRFIFFLSSVL